MRHGAQAEERRRHAGVRDGVARRVALRTTLKPDFETAIGAAFEAAAKDKGFFAALSFRPAAAQAADLLDDYDPRRVSQLNDAMRRIVERGVDAHFGARLKRGSFPAIVDEQLRVAKAVFAVSPAATFALTTHGSGYVREAALRAISDVPGPFALALLIHRLNDWTHEVRQVAEGKLAQLRNRLSADLVASCIELLWSFDAYGRTTIRADQLVASIAQDKKVADVLRGQLRVSSDARSARVLHHLLRSNAVGDELETLGTSSRNATVRAVATRAALTGAYRWKEATGAPQAIAFNGDRQILMRRALRDRSAKVQAAGLEWVVENRAVISDAAAMLLPFVLHRASSVADLAQFGLTALGVDWLATARTELVGSKGTNRLAADVLARCGNAEDGQRIYDAARGLAAGEAVPLLAASARLGNQHAAEGLMAIAFDGGDLAVARRAAAALKKALAVVPSQKLAALADRGNEFFARGFGRFFAHLGVLEQLETICRWERAGADFDLDLWFQFPRKKINRAAFLPSSSERERLFALLRSCPKTRSHAQRFLAIGPGGGS
jgi:hypothetical protein